MSRRWVILFLASWLLAPSLRAKDQQPRFKTVEIKHFPFAEGVELPPEFSDFLYAELNKELQKSGLFEQIVGEGEVVDAADVPHSVVIDGSVLEYKKGSAAKQVIIGFGAGFRSLTAQFSVRKRGSQDTVLVEQVKVKSPATWDAKNLARFLAHEIARQLKHRLTEQDHTAQTAPTPSP